MLFVILDAFRSANPVLLNSASFLIGLLCGYWTTLYLDRRKEFNAVVGPIRDRLLAMREDIWPAMRPVSASELDQLEPRLFALQRWRLRAALAAYQQDYESQQYRDSHGQQLVRDPAAFAPHIERLLAILKRR